MSLPNIVVGDRVTAQPLTAISPQVTVTGELLCVIGPFDIVVLADDPPCRKVRCYAPTAVKL